MNNKQLLWTVVALSVAVGIGLWIWLLLGGRSEEVVVNTDGDQTVASSTAPDAGCPKLATDFGLGATDASTKGDLAKLKTFLSVKKHLGTSTSDGTFNQGVSDALKLWQKSVGFEATGVIDAKMRTAIASACEAG